MSRGLERTAECVGSTEVKCSDVGKRRRGVRRERRGLRLEGGVRRTGEEGGGYR